MSDVKAMKTGCVKYLNARPLIEGMRADRRFELVLDAPSRLAAALVRGDLDLALVPVVTLLESPEFAYVPGLCIGADGPVDSVFLFERSAAPTDRRLRVLLDRHSRTSQMLVRIVLEEFRGRDAATIDYVEGDPRAALDRAEGFDAVLVIGDEALRRPEIPGFVRTDLAAAWRASTGLPFVFAAWIARRSTLAENPWLPEALARSLERGLGELPRLAAEGGALVGVEAAVARAYLERSICYRLTPRGERGLSEFLERVAARTRA